MTKSHHKRVITSTLALILLLFGRSGLAEDATAPWWSEMFSVRTAPDIARGCSSEGADVLRGISHAGWYGDWYIFEPIVHQSLINTLTACSRSGKRMLGYFDTGSMGEYMVLVNPDGEIIRNAWSLPQALKNERLKRVDEHLRAMWFGYPSFLFGRDKFDLQGSWPLQEPVLSHQGVIVDSAETFWDDNCTKDVGGRIKQRYVATVSENMLTQQLDESIEGALRKGGIPYLRGKKGTVGSTGWGMVHLCDIDMASKTYAELLARQQETVYGAMINFKVAGKAKEAPLRSFLDGVHVDDVSNIYLLNMKENGFGNWAVQQLGVRLKQNASLGQELESACREWGRQTSFSVSKASVSELRKCFEKIGSHPAWQSKEWRRDRWLQFRPFRELVRIQYEAANQYLKAVTGSLRHALGSDRDMLLTGNLIPLIPGGMALAGTVDLPLFEWRYTESYGTLKPRTGYPAGYGFLSRLAAKASRENFSIVSLYVTHDLSQAQESDHADTRSIEHVHWSLFFDLLANNAILDTGHQYRDGYSPGTPSTRERANKYISGNREWFGVRNFLADIGILFSVESQLASVSFSRFHSTLHNDEYVAWAELLTSQNTGWDVLVAEKMTQEALSKFKAIVIPGVITLSPNQKKMLLDYLGSGGIILASGVNGLFDLEQDGRSHVDQQLTFDDVLLQYEKSGHVYRCDGYLHNGGCRMGFVNHQLGKIKKSWSAKITGAEGKIVRQGLFVNVKVAEKRTDLYRIDMNRYQLQQSEATGERDDKGNEVRVLIQIPEEYAGEGWCAEWTSLGDDLPKVRTGATGLAHVEKRGAQLEVVVAGDEIRYFQSMSIQLRKCTDKHTQEETFRNEWSAGNSGSGQKLILSKQ